MNKPFDHTKPFVMRFVDNGAIKDYPARCLVDDFASVTRNPVNGKIISSKNLLVVVLKQNLKPETLSFEEKFLARPVYLFSQDGYSHYNTGRWTKVYLVNLEKKTGWINLFKYVEDAVNPIYDSSRINTIFPSKEEAYKYACDSHDTRTPPSCYLDTIEIHWEE